MITRLIKPKGKCSNCKELFTQGKARLHIEKCLFTPEHKTSNTNYLIKVYTAIYHECCSEGYFSLLALLINLFTNFILPSLAVFPVGSTILSAIYLVMSLVV